jgi:hypothetical protein
MKDVSGCVQIEITCPTLSSGSGSTVDDSLTVVACGTFDGNTSVPTTDGLWTIKVKAECVDEEVTNVTDTSSGWSCTIQHRTTSRTGCTN